MKKKSQNLFDKATFGKRLKILREKIDLTQEDFGNLIDRSRVAYNSIESGKVAPSISCMISIINTLKKHKVNVAADYLLGTMDQQNVDSLVGTYTLKIQKLESDLSNCEKINKLQDRILNQ